MNEDLFIDQESFTEQSVSDMYNAAGAAFEEAVKVGQAEHDAAWNNFLSQMNENN